ncbi:MAG: hypothetical protein WKF92_03030 [Pyrinomonadaceae bacterium]
MELEEQLKVQGYGEAERQLEEAKRAVEAGRKNLAAGVVPAGSLAGIIAGLTGLESRIPEMEKALAAEYAAAVKLVDAQNDADFAAEDILERAELVAEYFEEQGDPEKAEQVRSLMRGEHSSK